MIFKNACTRIFTTKRSRWLAYAVCLCILSSIVSCSNFMGFYDDHSDPSGPNNFFWINNKELYSYLLNVTLHSDVPEAVQMRFSNDGNTWSTWESYSPAKPWDIIYGNGKKTVYAEFRIDDGNIEKLNASIYFVDKAYSTPITNAQFGTSVSISDDGYRLITGSPYATVSGKSGAGLSSICTWDGTRWNYATITSPTPASNEHFGYSVSMSKDGTIVAIGAPGIGKGTIYIYSFNGSVWTMHSTCIMGILSSDAMLGSSVSMYTNGGTIMIVGGAPNDTPSTKSHQGSIVIFKWNGTIWTTQRLYDSPSSTDDNDNFGTSVCISGDGSICAIGAPGGNDTYLQQGKVYVYTFSSSTLESLTAPDGSTDDFFGNSVSLNGDGTMLLVGDRLDNTPTADNGSAYLFTRSGSWNLAKKFTPSSGTGDIQFGQSVSISPAGDELLIGAHRATVDAYTHRGIAYRYTKSGSTWIETVYSAPDGTTDNLFGNAVALSMDTSGVTRRTFAITSPSDSVDNKNASGSVYVFRD